VFVDRAIPTPIVIIQARDGQDDYNMYVNRRAEEEEEEVR
jgi:hypothetical protein